MGCELLQRPPRRGDLEGSPQEVTKLHEDTRDCGWDTQRGEMSGYSSVMRGTTATHKAVPPGSKA